MQQLTAVPSSNLIQMPAAQAEQPRDMFDDARCTFTPVGLIIEPGMPIDEWVDLGKKLQKAKDSLGIWRGDWINYGKHEYGKKYAAAVAMTGLKEHTLRDDVWISKAIPLSARADKLTTRHYRHLAPLRSISTIKMWIDKTLHGDKKKVWSAARLKKEIHKATNAAKAEPDEPTATPEKEPKEPPVLSAAARQFLDDYMAVIAKWAEKIPNSLPESEREALELMVYQHGADALRLKKRTRKSDCDAILKVLRDTEEMAHLGEMDASDLYDWLLNLRHFMALADYKDRLQYMNQDDQRKALLTDAGPGRQTGRKGALPWIVCKKWTKVRTRTEQQKRDAKNDEDED